MSAPTPEQRTATELDAIREILRAISASPFDLDDAAQHLGRPGDEGLDGVINEDALGLDKIYVQAKRYTDRIGQEQVRSFAGSLDGAHASKGVMITTSTFSPEAYRWVERIEKRLVLIDGAQLARYMIDYEIGVHLKAQFRMYRVDDDFFDPAG